MEGGNNHMVNNQMNNDKKQINNERIQKHLNDRKKNIQKILFSKRVHQSLKEQKKIKHLFVLEEPNNIKSNNINPVEEKKEEQDVRGFLDLFQHYKKSSKRNKKKCWVCKSPYHLKNSCPMQKIWIS